VRPYPGAVDRRKPELDVEEKKGGTFAEALYLAQRGIDPALPLAFFR
jgi:hypothetical protein